LCVVYANIQIILLYTKIKNWGQNNSTPKLG